MVIEMVEINACISNIIDRIENERDRYKEGFNILMEYFDSISDEERPKVDERLKKLGL